MKRLACVALALGSACACAPRPPAAWTTRDLREAYEACSRALENDDVCFCAAVRLGARLPGPSALTKSDADAAVDACIPRVETERRFCLPNEDCDRGAGST